MPSSQRPFFLSSLFAAFRPPPAPPLSTSSQPNKHTHPQPSGSASYSSSSSASNTHSNGPTTTTTSTTTTSSTSPPRAAGGGVMSQLPLHSPRPIPGAGRPGHRRGSDSSSEGFRDVLGADKWYIGGRTAAGEEKFFKLGVVKRVRSKDRLSLDQLSL
ncbi:hypothetical protein GGS20DRAFT_307273 [Poronia punctata]|nr:hypothetical protein GGS20DRAFT_307273 [Poronia punctata]